MFKIYDGYSPRANAPDVNYPYGSIRNESLPGADDGTPVDERLPNDYAGFDAALLAAAGIVADGDPDTAVASQRFEALKIVSGLFGCSVNYIQNHNFTIATTDDTEPRPDVTPRTYPVDYEVFAGWYADSTTGVTGLTYDGGLVNFTGGSIYHDVSKTDGLEFITGLIASPAGLDCLPLATGVTFSTVGNKYRVVVSSTTTNVFSVKFEKSQFPTRHEPYGSVADFNDPIGTLKWFAADTPPIGYLEVRQRTDLSPWPKLAALMPGGILEARGEFLRVWDNGLGVDTGRALGSFQADEIKAHRHVVPKNNGTGGINDTVLKTGTGSPGGNTSNTELTGGTETRGRNIAYMLIIRAA